MFIFTVVTVVFDNYRIYNVLADKLSSWLQLYVLSYILIIFLSVAALTLFLKYKLTSTGVHVIVCTVCILKCNYFVFI